MEEIWLERRVGGDYGKLAQEYHISPVLARVLANRGIRGEEEVRDFLNPSIGRVYEYASLPNIDTLTGILVRKIREGKKIRIIGDYDVDGVCATFILLKGLKKAGADADHTIPHRIRDGYGMNDEMIQKAADDGIDTILTCDNGIAAAAQVKLAHALNMTVLITDHHEVPYHMEHGDRVTDAPEADAVVDVKLPESRYPYREICGALIAFKVILALYHSLGIEQEEAEEFLEFAAFATIEDVMPLMDENRALVALGLKRLQKTKNPGMAALIRVQNVKDKELTPYHAGFILGPCINASGRLATAEHALRLLLTDKEEEAQELSELLATMNNERKEMTEEAVEKAQEMAESDAMKDDRVLVIFLPDCHESIAGIAAGRVREKTGKPVFVLTKGENSVKGSGRSIDEYDMYQGMTSVSDLFLKFGGHKMAGGLSLPEENIEAFRKRINANCTLSQRDLAVKLRFDGVLSFAAADLTLAKELQALAPFGTGNPKPVFAVRNVTFHDVKLYGSAKNCLKAKAKDESGAVRNVIYFGKSDELQERIKKGEDFSLLYTVEVNSFREEESLELQIKSYR